AIVVCSQFIRSTGTGSGSVFRQSWIARSWRTVSGGSPGRPSRKSRSSSNDAPPSTPAVISLLCPTISIGPIWPRLSFASSGPPYWSATAAGKETTSVAPLNRAGNVTLSRPSCLKYWRVFASSNVKRKSCAATTRIFGVLPTLAGSVAGSGAFTANPTFALASASEATTSGCGIRSPWTAPSRSSWASGDWPSEESTAIGWIVWLRNCARNAAAAVRPPSVPTTASTIAAARPAAATRQRRKRLLNRTTRLSSDVAAASKPPRRAASMRWRASAADAADGSAGGRSERTARPANAASARSSSSRPWHARQLTRCAATSLAEPSPSSSIQARSAPTSGQTMLSLPVGLAEGTLGARQDHADRSDGDAERRGDLGVRAAGVTQQQTLPLALWQRGQRAPHRRLLLPPDEGTLGLLAVDPTVCQLELANPLEPGSGAPLVARPVEREVQANTTQPGGDLVRGSIEYLGPRQAQERLLRDLLGLESIAEHAVGQAVQLAVAAMEGVRERVVRDDRLTHLGGTQHPLPPRRIEHRQRLLSDSTRRDRIMPWCPQAFRRSWSGRSV